MNESNVASLLRGIQDPQIRAAFLRVDRARFVPERMQHLAWADHPLPLDDQATISQPSLVASMTEALELCPGQRTLEIGTGSGYQTALLAELGAEVFTVEFDQSLHETARERLDALGYRHIHFRCGDGGQGWPEAAAFHRIIGTAAFETKPTAILQQLAPEGVALLPVGPPGETQQLRRFRATGSGFEETALAEVRFVPIRGQGR